MLTSVGKSCHAIDMDTMAKDKARISLDIDAGLHELLAAWIAQQEFPTTKTAVIEAALREFLNKRGRRK